VVPLLSGHFPATGSQSGFSGLFAASEPSGWLIGGVVIYMRYGAEQAVVDAQRVAGIPRSIGGLVIRAPKRYLSNMSTVQEIESAITQLEPRDIHAVADWLLEYRETLWDERIAADAHAGKLDPLIKKAKAGHRAGKATPFP